jgi:hypothetical protein
MHLMSRERRDKDGLTHRERKFALLMCKGMRIKEAYINAGYGDRLKPEQRDANAANNAYTKARQPQIVGFMSNWLAQARISDLDSPGAAVARTLRYLDKAEQDGNWTATAALQRLAYQHNGIAEKTTISIEASVNDADLLRRIAGDDSEKMGLLSGLLRPASFSHGEKRPLLIEGQATEDEELP